MIYQLNHYDAQAGRLVIATPSFDFDSYPALGEDLVQHLFATILEKQSDADLHSWLIELDGCKLLLRAEHYTESVWIESLNRQEAHEVLSELAERLQQGIGGVDSHL